MPVFGANPAHYHPARPESPERPAHPRSARPLPDRPREWSAVERTASTEECALIIDAAAHGIPMIAEGWGNQSDPDCLDGWTLILEGAADLRETRPHRCPAWVPDDLPLLLATVSACHAAQDLHAAELATYRAECGRILDAPETDPEWARYDMLRASLSERQRAWEDEHGAAFRAYEERQRWLDAMTIRRAFDLDHCEHVAAMFRGCSGDDGGA